MDIIRFSITNPVKVAVGVILILLFGVISIRLIPIQMTPDVERPVVRVVTQWTGRSPEEVEREIIEPQEEVLKNLTGLQRMTATAYEGRADIELEFSISIDVDTARVEVSDALREVSEYPDDVDEPYVRTGSGGAENPIAWLLLRSKNPDFDVQTLGDEAEDRIKPFLERVKGDIGKGVSEVRVYGARDREVHIDIDPDAMAQRGVTFAQLNRTLRSENLNVSAGNLAEGRLDVRVRTVEQLENFDALEELIIAYGDDGGPVRIRDIGTVSLGYQKREGFVRSRGQLSIALPVFRETGANVIETMEKLREEIKRVNEEILPLMAQQIQIEQGLDAPPELEVVQVYDETEYIYDALSLVQTNLYVGGILAVIVLMLFLRSVRPTLVVALAIPISIVGTFVVMAAAGRNINVISLAGLAFAVGMVVDNAIVVLENIDRHLQMNKRPGQAAYDATREVVGAIFASSLTTLAVFLPILTIQEESGQLFRDIALAICAAVTLSLIVSMTVIPTASARFLRTHAEPKLAITRRARDLFGLATLAGKAGDFYTEIVYKVTAPKTSGVMIRVLTVATVTFLAIAGSIILMPPTDYLPRGNQNLVFGFVLTPPSYTVEHREDIAERVESVMRPFWEVESTEEAKKLPTPIHPFTGQPVEPSPGIDNYFFVSFFGGMFHGGTSLDKENVAPLADLMTASVGKIPGTIGFAQQSSLFGRGAGGSRQIDVDVMSTNLDSALRAGSALYDVLREEYGQTNVQSDPPNFDLPGPQLKVNVDRVRAANMGIDAASVGAAVEGLIDGVNVGPFRYLGKSIDIIARRDPGIPLTPDGLRSTPFAYRDHQGDVQIASLRSIVDIERGDAPQRIMRVEELRAVTLSVTAPDTVPLEVATTQINQIVREMRETGVITPDVQINLAGSASQLQDVREALLGEWQGFNLDSLFSLGFSRIFLALLVTYLLMAALFESFLHPFVIMFAVPLATVGGFAGLAIVHHLVPTQQLDVLTMLGFVILIGVVVNNAILIVHQALNFMRGLGDAGQELSHALSPREAIRESVRTRLRPILMTTCTSVFGMLPLVVMPGAGSELYRGLGSVVVGGLLLSGMFTLLVVPLLFSLVIDAKIAIFTAMGWQIDEMMGKDRDL